MRWFFLLMFPLLVYAKDINVEQLFNITTTAVKKLLLSKKVKNYGYAKENSENIVDISPRFGGFIVELNANKLYKRVEKGELLATVYSPEVLQAKEDYLRSFQYNREKSRSQIVKSSKERLRLLGVEESEVKAVLTKNNASLNVGVYAPVSGYIYKKNVNRGGSFKSGETIFQIIDISDLWVETTLFEEQLSEIEHFSQFEVSFKGLNSSFKAKKSILYPKIYPEKGIATLRLELKNIDEKIFPGMYATVYMSREETLHLTLPKSALIRKNGAYYAFVAGEYEGEYRPKRVEAKVLNSKLYKIISGLEDGEVVVSSALFLIDSDAQINGLY